MCTAASYTTRGHYFGRSLDLEYSYHETVTLTPRNYPFAFREAGEMRAHYALLGMAFVQDGYPLYYDAMNEKGLCMAGLNFPGYAVYRPSIAGKDNIASFEFIPWVLGQCASLAEARALLSRLNLTPTCFSEKLPASQLHWMISDRTGDLVVEQTQDGLHVHENPAGVMTNNPEFDKHMWYLSNFMTLSPEPPVNTFAKNVELPVYCKGMAAMGLPGDLSSASRFVKAAFTRLNSVSGETEGESVNQFFHILGSVFQQRGPVHLGGGKYEITVYTSCMSADLGVYYYTTYENSRITGVNMRAENLDADAIKSWALVKGPQVLWENAEP